MPGASETPRADALAAPLSVADNKTVDTSSRRSRKAAALAAASVHNMREDGAAEAQLPADSTPQNSFRRSRVTAAAQSAKSSLLSVTPRRSRAASAAGPTCSTPTAAPHAAAPAGAGSVEAGGAEVGGEGHLALSDTSSPDGTTPASTSVSLTGSPTVSGDYSHLLPIRGLAGSARAGERGTTSKPPPGMISTRRAAREGVQGEIRAMVKTKMRVRRTDGHVVLRLGVSSFFQPDEEAMRAAAASKAAKAVEKARVEAERAAAKAAVQRAAEEAEAAAAELAKLELRFTVNFIRLSNPEALNCRRLKIEVDALGLSETAPAGSAAPPPGLSPGLTVRSAVASGGELLVKFSHRVGIAPGSAARRKLRDALLSPSLEDSDVYFVLHGFGGNVPREGVELATGWALSTDPSLALGTVASG